MDTGDKVARATTTEPVPRRPVKGQFNRIPLDCPYVSGGHCPKDSGLVVPFGQDYLRFQRTDTADCGGQMTLTLPVNDRDCRLVLPLF